MASTASTILSGGCQCRAVRYTISLPNPDPSLSIKALCYCHCGACRRLSGSAFMPFLEFDASLLSFESGGSLAIMQGKSDGTDRKVSEEGSTTITIDGNITMTPLNISDKATRTFCRDCGSPISMVYHSNVQLVAIVMGTLDDEAVKGVLTEDVVKEKATAICMREAVGWGDVKVLARVGSMSGNPEPTVD